MIWLFFALSAFAQDEAELKAIRDLEKDLPSPRFQEGEGINQRLHHRGHRAPNRPVPLEKILASGTEYGYIKEGSLLYHVKGNKSSIASAPFYAKFFRLPDDLNFKYIQNNDGTCTYKIPWEKFVSVKEELALYEPPLKYTPAPTNIMKSEYDTKLNLRPEASFYAGLVQGTYMRDLFNDENASGGYTVQYGAHLMTEWDLPVKAGAAVHYEKTTYDLQGGGKINYSAISFGPQFKSKEFDFEGYAVRFQTQFRVSPFAKAYAQTQQGDVTFKFNSADLMVAAEHPEKNAWGEVVFGLFFQAQWLNIKDQPEAVSINPSNETNKSFGLSISQVFL